MVNYPVLFEQSLPCQGAKKEVHPHGQNKDQDNEVMPLYLHVGKDHRQRISQKEADDGTCQRKQESKPERLCVSSRGDGNDIVKGEGARFVSQTVVKYHT